MRRTLWVPIATLAIAVLALVASVGFAISREHSDDHGHARAGWMMGYAGSGSNRGPVGNTSEARSRAQAFADRLGLRVDEVMHFQRNYYAKLVDSSGKGATEVLVNPGTGVVSLEYGPAMMWNTRYGMLSAHGSRSSMMGGGGGNGMTGGGSANGRMMGGQGTMGPGQGQAQGMMGAGGQQGMMGAGASSAGTGPVATVAQARAVAQRWLTANDPGVKVESAGDAFPGYFTLETLRSGRIEGMISVDAQTGAVWRHWWHGAMVNEPS